MIVIINQQLYYKTNLIFFQFFMFIYLIEIQTINKSSYTLEKLPKEVTSCRILIICKTFNQEQFICNVTDKSQLFLVSKVYAFV